MSDSRHVQLSRIYERPITSDQAAREAVAGDPGVLAFALFGEAVASDDVTSVESAREYLEGRLAYLGDFATEAAPAVRDIFEMRLQAWL